MPFSLRGSNSGIDVPGLLFFFFWFWCCCSMKVFSAILRVGVRYMITLFVLLEIER